MTLVTIDGHIGAGEGELGRSLARMLDLQYVDRLLLPDVRHPEAAEPRQPALSDRVWAFVEKALRGIALGNAAGDPYFSSEQLLLFPLTWDSAPGAPMTSPEEDGKPHPHSVQNLIARGKSVLVHRAGAVALKGHGGVFKIGIFSTWEDRVRRVMSAEGITNSATAEKVIRQREEAQRHYFNSVHSSNPEDRSLYDICIDTSVEQINLATLKIARAVRAMAPVPA